MSEAPWIAWIAIAPLAGGALGLVAGRWLRWVVTAWLIATLGASAAVIVAVARDGALGHASGGWAAPLGIALRVDGPGALLLLALALVFGLVVLDALLDPAPERPAHDGFLRVVPFAWAACDALVLAADVFNLYVALELTTLAAVTLIALGDDRAALRAALRYLLFALAGSLAYLVGVVLLYASAPTLDLARLGAALAPGPAASAAAVAMALGLALKSGLAPLHGWLPGAYVHAPPRAAALLSGVIGKVAFVALLRLVVELFLGRGGDAVAAVLGGLGAAAVVWGSALALRQRRLRRILAYSSVGQIGYLFVALGLGTRGATDAAMVLVLSHAVAAAAAFLAVGAIERAVGGDQLAGLVGLAHRMPNTFFALGLAGLTLTGVPPSGGFVAKWLLLREALAQGAGVAVAALVVGGLLAAAYVLRMIQPAFLPRPADAPDVTNLPGRQELAALALALLSVALGLAPELPLAILAGGAP